ncbi:hypothetical protein QQS21_007104 [Conoideocrella luteorostrata]|uniref:Uncharacterized protein n=1 Tax=Conoideocrella luteorostrata TaxID=1105319 RepID=A0AAJ0FXD5_9HYPO|nr:hypothetical protein QQS21_007104 [Conoideocrella luteorostrata]
MDPSDINYDSDETVTPSSASDSTGSLEEFIDDTEISGSCSQSIQTKEEDYIEILDYISEALSNLRLMIQEDASKCQCNHPIVSSEAEPKTEGTEK